MTIHRRDSIASLCFPCRGPGIKRHGSSLAEVIPQMNTRVRSFGCGALVVGASLLMLLGAPWLCCAAQSSVVISEILYHPASDNTGDEYVELYNRGDASADLSGWILSGGISFVFPGGTSLPGNGYLVVARNAPAAAAFYGIPNVLGSYTGRLNNAGDTVRLEDGANPRQTVAEVIYGDKAPWPVEADGAGASIELIIPENDNKDPSNWGAGQPYTPGRPNLPAHARGGAVVINEIMYRPQRAEVREKFDASHPGIYNEVGDDELGEFIELFNRSTNAVDLTGWRVADGVLFDFPSGAVIPAGEFLVVAAHPEVLTARFAIRNVVGPYSGALDDSGARITLRDSAGRISDTVRFGDRHPWATAPDQLGYSLECIDPNSDNSTPANWRSSQSPLLGLVREDWQTVNLTVTARSSDLFLSLDGPGEWLVDELEVRPASGGENLLPGGSFEPGTSGWTGLGNHIGSKLITGSASGGKGSLLLIASGAGDADTNLLRFATIPGLVIGQSYTISCKTVFKKGAESLSMGFLGGGAPARIRAQSGIHNLSGDWSDTVNPSIGWSYRQRSGTIITARVNRWRTADLGGNQPAWTAGGATGAPGWCRSTGSSSAAGAPHPDYDFPTGAVMSNGPSEVWWTADSDRQLNLSGGVWLLRHIGRGQHWYIKLNDTEITAGDLQSADTGNTSRSPLSFESGTGGRSALVVNVHAGDSLKFGVLPLAPNRNEDYVGYDISIAFGDALVPSANKPPIAGFIGRGTPGRRNSVYATSLPPFIEDLAHAPAAPTSTNNVIVTAHITGQSPLTSVRLTTTLNVATNETILDMFDDGLHGDGAAGDGLYGVTVPARKSQTLVHYRVTATDSQGGVTTLPYPDEPSPTQAYFHYDDEIVTGSRLIHMFITSQNIAILDANPNTDDAVDCSLVIDHVAYPHVGTNYRGRGSRNNPKRPWKFVFNKGMSYRGNGSYETMFSVPLEQELAFEVFESAGIENLDHEPVRLHINGAFWGWYIGFENPTSSWLDKHGHSPLGEVYKARSVETANQGKNSDLYHNQIVTDYDYWGVYHKKVRPLDSPTDLKELIHAVNDLSDIDLLPWLDANMDLDHWFKRWALNVCMNIDDFPGHNYYMFHRGEPGGKWTMLGYDFDSGFTYGRVGPLRALYGDGSNGDSPAWQRNKLYQRVSINPTLKRIYLLTLRKMVNEVMLLDKIFPRIDQLFTLTAPDRVADLGSWATVRSSTSETKSVLTSQRNALSNFLSQASTKLPSADKAPVIFPTDAALATDGQIRITGPAGWQIFYTLDGSDPRLSPGRRPYVSPLPVMTNDWTLRAAAIPTGTAPALGDWTDLTRQTFAGVPVLRLIVARVGALVELSWPAQFTNQVLEAADSVEGPWIALPNAQVSAEGSFQRIESPAGATRFYRLRQQ